jgi:Domain of unknown function (DUF4158)
MPHRELLTESQRLSLQAPASDERGMVCHYTLSSEDLALINRRRGDPNRLGFALMLCYLRFPGRILQQGEQPPAALTRRPMSSTDCFITRAALSLTSTTPTPGASPIMSLPCAVCWASALRRAFAT